MMTIAMDLVGLAASGDRSNGMLALRVGFISLVRFVQPAAFQKLGASLFISFLSSLPTCVFVSNLYFSLNKLATSQKVHSQTY